MHKKEDAKLMEELDKEVGKKVKSNMKSVPPEALDGKGRFKPGTRVKVHKDIFTVKCWNVVQGMGRYDFEEPSRYGFEGNDWEFPEWVKFHALGAPGGGGAKAGTA